jgi:hypothetical protein
LIGQAVLHALLFDFLAILDVFFVLLFTDREDLAGALKA